MRAFDIQVQFPANADGTPGRIAKFPAVYLEGADPQHEAIRFVAEKMGTLGLTITAQPSE